MEIQSNIQFNFTLAPNDNLQPDGWFGNKRNKRRRQMLFAAKRLAIPKYWSIGGYFSVKNTAWTAKIDIFLWDIVFQSAKWNHWFECKVRNLKNHKIKQNRTKNKKNRKNIQKFSFKKTDKHVQSNRLLIGIPILVFSFYSQQQLDFQKMQASLRS